LNDLFVRGVTEGREGAEKGRGREIYHNPLSGQVLDRDFRGSSHYEVLSVVDSKSFSDKD
jgi:hypothetical protein